MAKPYPPAVVLGMSPTGLGVIRGLGRRGIKVWGNDIDWYRAGFFSKFCRRLATLNCETEENKLVDKLIEFSSQLKVKPVIFATDDEYLIFLARNSDALTPYFHFPRVDSELVETFLNKRKFYEICEKYEIPQPVTYMVGDENELRKIANVIRFPAIIKPIYSHVWALKYGFLKAIKVKNRFELIEQYEKLNDMKANVIVQEVISGKEDQIFIFSAYFNELSEPIRIFTGRKIRQYPYEFGTTTVAESLWEPEVADLSIRLLRHLKFQGLCDVEFKKDPLDQRFKIIEINPRVARWHSLTDAVGTDLSFTAFSDLIGEKVRPTQGFEEHVKWVFLFRDVPTSIKLILNGMMSLSSWWKSIQGKREHAIFSWQDPMPAITYGFEMVAKGTQGFWRQAKEEKGRAKAGKIKSGSSRNRVGNFWAF